MPITLDEADAFLSTTLYGDGWAANAPGKRRQALNSAAALLRASYPGIAEVLSDYVCYQAAYMLTGAYAAFSNKISSQSVSTGGVSQSFASGQRLEKRDLLAPEVLFGLGAPPKTAGSVEIGAVG